ncbi:MAG: ATP synthase subunit I [Proteobacteria bacterium]|nr:ATP synthase subunit I [Pseudomonadota bacterium]
MATSALNRLNPTPGTLYRMAGFNIVAGALGTGVTAIINSTLAPDFAVGYLMGVANLVWLFIIARRAMGKGVHFAGRMVARNYYIRFLLTAVILILLISKGIMEPWPMVAGLTTAIFVSIGAMVLSIQAEEE